MGGRTAKGMSATGRMPDGRKVSVSLNHVAALASWATVTKSDANGAGLHGDGAPDLRTMAQMAAWPTATARDHFPAHSEYIAAKKAQGHGMANLNDLVQLAGPIRVNRFGQMLAGSDALTEIGGQLNPEHVCWLQGYPVEWLFSAPESKAEPRTRTARAARSKGLETP
jgi:hypothetical protein